MNTFSCLIFDLDGTLIDSSDGVVEAVNYSLRRMGQPEQPREAITPYIGYPLETMYPKFTDAPVVELRRHFAVKAIESMVASTVVLEGVEGVLRRLDDQGYRMAIATTKIRPHVDGIIAKFGWESYFPTAVGGDEVASVKPDPEAFHLALRRLGAGAEEALVVGDTINDVLAARAVPVKIVAVASPYGGRDKTLAARPDFFLNSIEELPGLLNSAGDRRT